MDIDLSVIIRDQSMTGVVEILEQIHEMFAFNHYVIKLINNESKPSQEPTDA